MTTSDAPPSFRHETTRDVAHIDEGYVQRLVTHPNYPAGLYAANRRADRQDADLMWYWQCQEVESLFGSRLDRLLWLGIGLPVEYFPYIEKPRLGPCALTLEDFEIILGCAVQSRERILSVEFMYRTCDRRDADLMLRAQLDRAVVSLRRIGADDLKRSGLPHLALVRAAYCYRRWLKVEDQDISWFA